MKKLSKNLSIYIVIFVLVAGMAWFFTSSKPADESEQINTSKIVEYLQKEDVKSINISETKITATLKNGDVVYAYVNSVVDYQFIYDEWSVASKYNYCDSYVNEDSSRYNDTRLYAGKIYQDVKYYQQS